MQRSFSRVRWSEDADGTENFCTEMYDQAMEYLREDVVELIRDAFDSLAVPMVDEDDASKQAAEAQRWGKMVSKTGTRSPTKKPEGSAPQCGVPFEKIPELLEMIGCGISEGLVRAKGSMLGARH